MAPQMKRRRGNPRAAARDTTTGAWTLPADLMLEIVARSDLRTLFRSAAACKLLRREILSPSFIRRLSHQAAPCILAYFCTYEHKPLTLVYPSTTVAASFCQDHLQRSIDKLRRSMPRKVGIRLDKYRPVTSRRGLVLLVRRNIRNRPTSQRCFDMCVYDSMSGARTFLSRPPDINTNEDLRHKYVLLTAADGIDCSFQLLAAYFYGCSIKVQIASSCGTWGPVTYVKDDKFWWCFVKYHCDPCNPAVLRGGVIHWLASYPDKQILSFDLGTGKPGSVKLPSTNSNLDQLHLVTSSDGKQLKLLAIEGFKISVWLQLPVSAAAAGGSGWSLETVIDIRDDIGEKLRLLEPDLPLDRSNVSIVFEGSGTRTGDVVLLRIIMPKFSGVIVLDLETKDMRKEEWGSVLLEIDLPSRLQNMKIFP